ncbi:undecaprenyl/decaprenyl-phosphate alpha-N-acetylglucosaminyl 1-phosphate transferase, partial [Intestinibacillus massiliensis]|nr:undecaprenyl/decaprenyl-phosphate alpha-N-acetylglucosaminyl 1-phosphate transferase [Intestinibacillus massiliensis]
MAATLMLAVAGGVLGFLPFNFHPAKIFMGDGGSQFLGFCLATFSLIQPVKSATVVAVGIPALVLGLPIFDTAFAILRRVIRRQSIVVADKEHLHHRIMRAGFGQRRSVMIMYCISGIMGVVSVLYSRGEMMMECLGLMAIVVMLLYVLLSD